MSFLIPPWVGPASAAALALFAGFIGYRVGDAHTDRVLNKINNHTITMVAKADAVSQAVGAETVKVVERVRWNTVTLHEEIPVYVPPQVDVQYAVPAGFVSVWNASAAGLPLPDPAGQSVGAPSGVAFSTLADAVAANHGSALECEALLTGWQDWARRQQSLAAKGK